MLRLPLGGLAAALLLTGCASSPLPDRAGPPAERPSATPPGASPAVATVPAEVLATVDGRTYHQEPLCTATVCAGCSSDPGRPAVHVWAVDTAGRTVFEWTGCAEDAPAPGDRARSSTGSGPTLAERSAAE